MNKMLKPHREYHAMGIKYGKTFFFIYVVLLSIMSEIELNTKIF